MRPWFERYFSHHRETCCNGNEEKIVNDSPDDGTASPANDCSLWLIYDNIFHDFMLMKTKVA